MDAPAQPIPTFVSPEAPAGDAPKKPRFTRAEKGQFAKKTAQGKKHQKKDIDVPSRFTVNSSRDVDDMIVALLKLREQVGDRKGKGKGKDAKSLENRITRDSQGQKKEMKELSPKKLEKIQKRREIRAERKQAWLAKKAAEGAPSAPEPSLAAPAPTPAQPAFLDSDEINFDEL